MRVAALATVLLLLAGCSSPPEDAEAPDAAPPDDATVSATPSAKPVTVVGATADGHRFVTTSWEDSIDLTLPYGVPEAPYDQQDPRRLLVEANVTAVLIEVAWDDTTTDLNAYVIPGPCPDLPDVDADCEVALTTRTGHWYEARGGGPGAGDSPSRLLLPAAVMMEEPCLPCEWTFGAHTQTAAARVVVQVHVTLFYGLVPDGFTALA